MLTFILAVALLIGTPGPGVLTLAGIGAAFGSREGQRFLAGLFIGHNLVSMAVIGGLAATVLAVPGLREILALTAALYILWLAFRIATVQSRIAFVENLSPPGFMGGLAFQAINPKAYAVSTAIFANFPLMPENLGQEITLKLLIFNVLWLMSHSAWLYLGLSLRRLDLTEHKQHIANYVMACALIIAVALAFLHF